MQKQEIINYRDFFNKTPSLYLRYIIEYEILRNTKKKEFQKVHSFCVSVENMAMYRWLKIGKNVMYGEKNLHFLVILEIFGVSFLSYQAWLKSSPYLPK